MTSCERKILVVAPDFPFPPNHGGRSDVFGRILAFKRLGWAVDLIATVKELPAECDQLALNKFVDHTVLVKRDRSLTNVAGLLPFQVKSRSGLKSCKVPTDRYDLALLESEYVSPVLANNQLVAKRIALRVHNNERIYFMELARSASRIVQKAFYLSEALKFVTHTESVLHSVDAAFFISKSEFERSAGVGFWLPPSVQTTKLGSTPPSLGCVLFVGSLFMPNNREGLEWYLSQVHPTLFDIQGYHLVIAGNTSGINVSNLTKGLNKVTLVPDPSVAQLDDLYRQATVFIAPMFRGAGVKMKVVNAIASGLPVVATSVSVEGSGFENLKHLLVADDPGDFSGAVRLLYQSARYRQQLVGGAKDFLRKEYDTDRALSSVIDELDRLPLREYSRHLD